MGAEEAIVARGLTKVYGKHIGRRRTRSLDALDLTVHRNEVFGFLGRNGAGKTTTIKLFCSLLRPTRGEAYVLGENVRRPAARRAIGYLPENPYFYEYLTPRETLDFYGHLHGVSAEERAHEWERLAELLDLHSMRDQRVRGFSKGMRQRLGFAVALVGNPEVLILDEPMTGLDPLERRRIRKAILSLRDEGKTIFFSSHVLGDVEQICDRVGILVKGKLASQGRISTLLSGRAQQVEVVAQGLDDQALSGLASRAVSSWRSDAGHHFLAEDLEEGNALVREILGRNGRVVEFAPVKESLEDFFMRKQELAG